MSRNSEPTLHIEWSPSHVTAMDIGTGQTASADTLAGLGSLLSGHRHALVGISRRQVFLKTVRLPKAAPEDLRRILEVQLGQFFPLPPSQLAFDCLQTSDSTQEGILTVVAAVRTEELKQLQTELKQAGLTASRILPVALGAVAVAAHAQIHNALVMEFTPAGLALDVVKDGVLRLSRLVPGEADPACEAQRTLAAARIESLPFLTAGKTTLPGALAGEGTALSRLHEAPPFRFEMAEDRIREAKKQVAARTRLAAIMLTAAVLMVVSLWIDRTDAMVSLQSGEARWNGQLNKLRALQTNEAAKAQQSSAIAVALKRAFETPQPLSDILAAMDDSLPSGAWLTGLTAERGKPLQIRGTSVDADDVGKFVNALGSMPRFRDVKLIFANSARIEDTTVVQFNVSAVAVGNLPMPEPDKKGAKARKATPAPSSSSKTEAGQ